MSTKICFKQNTLVNNFDKAGHFEHNLNKLLKIKTIDFQGIDSFLSLTFNMRIEIGSKIDLLVYTFVDLNILSNFGKFGYFEQIIYTIRFSIKR